MNKEETFNLTMSLLLNKGVSDFDITWAINNATEQMDEFSRKFHFLEKPIRTWVTGWCYLDYDCTEKILPIDRLINGEKKIHISVTRKYLIKPSL